MEKWMSKKKWKVHVNGSVPRELSKKEINKKLKEFCKYQNISMKELTEDYNVEDILLNEFNIGTFEISVLKTNNKHGQKSFGWDGVDKIILFSGDWYEQSHYKVIWNTLIECANMLRDKLNEENNGSNIFET